MFQSRTSNAVNIPVAVLRKINVALWSLCDHIIPRIIGLSFTVLQPILLYQRHILVKKRIHTHFD